MTEAWQMLSARVPPELKDLVDADQRNNQEVVRAALWREFGGQRKGDLERRIDEKQRRRSVIEEERDQREDELAEIDKELAALREKLNKKEKEQRQKLDEAFDALKDVPKRIENPAIQNWAEKLDMTPEELIDKLGGVDE